MSNDPIRLTFADGTQLYSYGNTSDFCFNELYETVEGARRAYYEWQDDSAPLAFTPPGKEERAKASAETVVAAETTYGSPDRSWRPMLLDEVQASKAERLVVAAIPYGTKASSDHF